MKTTLPFNLRDFQEAHKFVVNAQNAFVNILAEVISKKTIFSVSSPVEFPGSSGKEFMFYARLNVCDIPVNVYFNTDNEFSCLLFIHFTCKDMFITTNQKLGISANHITLHWIDVSGENNEITLQV